MTTAKEVKEKCQVDTCSKNKGVFTVRVGFFYRHGRTAEWLKEKVLNAYPQANIVEFGEVWKPFGGGASVANSSHWFIKFTLP